MGKNNVSGYSFYSMEVSLQNRLSVQGFATEGEIYYESTSKEFLKYITGRHQRARSFEPNNGYYHELINFTMH